MSAAAQLALPLPDVPTPQDELAARRASVARDQYESDQALTVITIAECPDDGDAAGEWCAALPERLRRLVVVETMKSACDDRAVPIEGADVDALFAAPAADKAPLAGRLLAGRLRDRVEAARKAKAAASDLLAPLFADLGIDLGIDPPPPPPPTPGGAA